MMILSAWLMMETKTTSVNKLQIMSANIWSKLSETLNMVCVCVCVCVLGGFGFGFFGCLLGLFQFCDVDTLVIIHKRN
jgi:ABC-type proline/glycine betaine transport system permease subunit